MRVTEDNGGGGPDRSRLRRMLEDIGAERLSDAQLLSLVLPGGPRGGEGRKAEDLLRKAGGVAGLARVTRSEMMDVAGIGRAGAASVAAAVELGLRVLSGPVPGERLGSSADVHAAFGPIVVSERTESFFCALVDARLRLIRIERVSMGTLTASIVHPREAYNPAIRHSASAVIFVHNHPSGDPAPSEEDRRITARLEQVGDILGIPLLDHVIMGSNGSYYSFVDAGETGPRGSGYRGMVIK